MEKNKRRQVPEAGKLNEEIEEMRERLQQVAINIKIVGILMEHLKHSRLF